MDSKGIGQRRRDIFSRASSFLEPEIKRSQPSDSAIVNSRVEQVLATP